MGALLTTVALNVTVIHVEQSRPVVPRIVEAARAAAEYLAPLYGLPPDQPVTVLWLPQEHWASHTSLPYGFPSNSGGREVLPAVDIDSPVELARLANLLSLEDLGPNELARFAQLLELPAASAGEVDRHLRSSEAFYLDFCIDFILPHEVAHALNNAAGTARQPTWLHEWQAQIAAILVCRHRNQQRQEELFTRYYRLMYEHGQRKVQNRTLPDCIAAGYTAMGIENYAYFHGLLLEMYCQLEGKHGAGFGERLLGVLLRRTKGRPEISDADVIALCSEAAGTDLAPWFRQRWGMPAERVR
jgi:DnaJ-domain-containing protein 1